MKTFVDKYDTVTDPSGEGQGVRKEMTVQVEQWWNSSDVESENPGISLCRVKRPHRHVMSSVRDHLFPLTEILSLN